MFSIMEMGWRQSCATIFSIFPFSARLAIGSFHPSSRDVPDRMRPLIGRRYIRCRMHLVAGGAGQPVDCWRCVVRRLEASPMCSRNGANGGPGLPPHPSIIPRGDNHVRHPDARNRCARVAKGRQPKIATSCHAQQQASMCKTHASGAQHSAILRCVSMADNATRCRACPGHALCPALFVKATGLPHLRAAIDAQGSEPSANVSVF